MDKADTERFWVVSLETCDKELDEVKVLWKGKTTDALVLTPIGDTTSYGVTVPCWQV